MKRERTRIIGITKYRYERDIPSIKSPPAGNKIGMPVRIAEYEIKG